MTRPYLDISAFRNHSQRRAKRLLDTYNDNRWRTEAYRSFLIGTLVLELDNLLIQSLRAYAFCRIWQGQRSGIVAKIDRKFMSSAEYTAHFVRILSPAKYVKLHSPTVLSREHEWSIRDPKDVAKIIQGVCGAVPVELNNAIALNCRVFYETKIVRHFYAHRCEDTMLKLKAALPIFSSGIINHPDDYLENILPGSSEAKFITWWSEYDDFFSVA